MVKLPMSTGALLVALMLWTGCGLTKEGRDPSPVTSACDELAQFLRDRLALDLTPVDSLVVDPFTRVEAPGCRLDLEGETSDYAPGESPDDVLRDETSALGWQAAFERGADGPDGTVFGIVKGGVVCNVRGAWDGGDDSDDAYVPAPWYALEVVCLSFGPD